MEMKYVLRSCEFCIKTKLIELYGTANLKHDYVVYIILAQSAK